MRNLIAMLLIASSVAAVVVAFTPARALALEEVTEEEEDVPQGRGGYARRFGIGIIAGEPTALTAKLFLSSSSAFQLHVGYGFGRHDKLAVLLDYLLHFNGVIPPIERAGRLAPYVGIGALIGIHYDEALLGIRVPFGLSFMINSAPIEVFVEVGIGIGIIPSTVLIVNGGLGARYYF